MIPATHITIDGDTAWLVYEPGVDPMFRWKQADRPCDTCGGDLEQLIVRYGVVRCPDCINGRHTFDIEVECVACKHFDAPDAQTINCWNCEAGRVTYRVSVVPGMVLPIVADVGPVLDGLHIRVTGAGIAWLAEPIDGGGWKHTDITMPPAAAPGMWAIKLRITPENVEEPCLMCGDNRRVGYGNDYSRLHPCPECAPPENVEEPT